MANNMIKTNKGRVVEIMPVLAQASGTVTLVKGYDMFMEMEPSSSVTVTFRDATTTSILAEELRQYGLESDTVDTVEVLTGVVRIG